MWWLLHDLSKPEGGKWDALAVRMLIEVQRERSLWNPKVLLHVCHPKDSCLGEPWCHQEHLGNSLTCLYNINLSHISIAGSCVIISSHVLSGRGPSQSRRLVLSSAQSTGNRCPPRCALCFLAKAENVWAAKCKAEAQGSKFMAGRYDKWNRLHLRCKWSWAVQGVTGLGRHYTACSVIVWHSTAERNKLKSSEEVQFV